MGFGKKMALFLLGTVLFSCGPTDRRELVAFGRPIINGTADTSAAHMATVAICDRQNSYFCSGSLIAESVVMTAAHCLDVGNPTSFLVFFGNNAYQGSTGTYRGVSEGRQHPNWNERTLEGDIALLRLSSPAPASVTPIPHLPANLGLTQADVGTTVVDFSGFGMTERGTDGVKLHVQDTIDVVCDSAQGCDGGNVVQYGMGYDQNPGGPCSGDSGGPAYVKRNNVEYVAGVTSYGDQNCRYYGVSTMADRYDSWIQDFIGGVTHEICNNNVDDDGDQLADCNDPDCASYPLCSGDTACTNAPSIVCGQTVNSTTVGGVSMFRTYSCLSQATEDGPEVAYRLDIQPGAQVEINMSHAQNRSDLDLFLLPAVGTGCDPAGCLASSTEYQVAERIVFTMPAGGAYVVVETWENATTFTLSVTCSGVQENCSNNVDDDGDGRIDCADTDCSSAPNCQVPPENCSNGVDDDQDGRVDCVDDQCNGQSCGPNGRVCAGGVCQCLGGNVEAACGDNQDNDCDGQKDCADGDCQGQACDTNGRTCNAGTCQCPGGNVEAACGDNQDNDCDGQKDCADGDCQGQACDTNGRTCNAGTCQCPGGNVETACGDNQDNDCDGQKDCVDSDCAGLPACQLPPENCSNQIDDDGDQLFDCSDPDCATDPACHENCSNGVDDDGDSLADCDDSECAVLNMCQQGGGGGCGCSQPGKVGTIWWTMGWLALMLARRRQR